MTKKDRIRVNKKTRGSKLKEKRLKTGVVLFHNVTKVKGIVSLSDLGLMDVKEWSEKKVTEFFLSHQYSLLLNEVCKGRDS